MFQSLVNLKKDITGNLHKCKTRFRSGYHLEADDVSNRIYNEKMFSLGKIKL